MQCSGFTFEWPSEPGEHGCLSLWLFVSLTVRLFDCSFVLQVDRAHSGLRWSHCVLTLILNTLHYITGLRPSTPVTVTDGVQCRILTLYPSKPVRFSDGVQFRIFTQNPSTPVSVSDSVQCCILTPAAPPSESLKFRPTPLSPPSLTPSSLEYTALWKGPNVSSVNSQWGR